MFNTPDELALIISAAGASSRMGSPKGLISIDSRPLYQHHVENFWSSFPAAKSIIVLGNHLVEYRHSIESFQHPKLQMIINQQHHLGQFSSIQCGAIAALETPIRWAYLQPVDLPPLSPALYQMLYDCRQNFWGIKPRYQQRSGHPLLISRDVLELIAAADPITDRLDHLLRTIPQHKMKWIDTNEAGVVQNLNSPEALENYMNNWRNR